ncbi:hypothetical protein HK096_008139, partial [Nowakowskiella sp. JEL0078]
MKEKDNVDANMGNNFNEENLPAKILTSASSIFAPPPPSARSIALRNKTPSGLTQIDTSIPKITNMNSRSPTSSTQHEVLPESPTRISTINRIQTHPRNLDQNNIPRIIIPQRSVSVNTTSKSESAVTPPVSATSPPASAMPASTKEGDVEAQTTTVQTSLHRIIAFFNQPINPNGAHNHNWIIVINLLHVMNVLIAPLAMAWTDLFSSTAWIVVFCVLDAFFLLDCMVQSRLSYKNEYGIEIRRLNELRDDYLFKRYGWLEFLSSLPWDLWGFYPTNSAII